MTELLLILGGAFAGQIVLLFFQSVNRANALLDEEYKVFLYEKLYKDRVKSWWKIAREYCQLEKEMRWMRQANEQLEAEKNKLYVELDIYKAREVRKLGPKKSTTAIDPDGKIQQIRE